MSERERLAGIIAVALRNDGCGGFVDGKRVFCDDAGLPETIRHNVCVCKESGAIVADAILSDPAYGRAGEMPDAGGPERAHTLIAKFGADTAERLANELRWFADEIDCNQITVGCIRGPSAGAIEMMAADGEWYEVEIRTMSDRQIAPATNPSRNPPMADLTRYHRERYFDPELEEWDGPFPLRCAAVVADDAQCSRKRGHGPEGAFCKQHAKRHEERRDDSGDGEGAGG